MHFVSESCKGEVCSICGEAATHKIGEEIFSDDPYPVRHNRTAYICCVEFRLLMGPTATGDCDVLGSLFGGKSPTIKIGETL